MTGKDLIELLDVCHSVDRWDDDRTTGVQYAKKLSQAVRPLIAQVEDAEKHVEGMNRLLDLTDASVHEIADATAKIVAQRNAHLEVVGWAQAVLTALNARDVKRSSPLHLALREGMIEYRVKLAKIEEMKPCST